MEDSEAITPTEIIPGPRFQIRVYDFHTLELKQESRMDCVLATSAHERAKKESRNEWGRNYVVILLDRDNANSALGFRGGQQMTAARMLDFSARMEAHKAEIRRSLNEK